MKVKYLNVTGSIHLNKSRNLWYLNYKNSEGKQTTKGLGTVDKKEAKLLAVEFLKQLYNSTGDRLRISDVMQHFIKHKQVKPNTINKAKYHFGRVFQEFFDNCYIDEIGFQEMSRYKTHLKNKKKLQRGGIWNESTISNNLRSVKQVWNFGRTTGIINQTHDIFLGIKIPEIEPRSYYLNPKQLSQLLEAAADKPIYQAGIEFLYNSGFRIGELHSLKWEDVQDNTIILRETKTKKYDTMPILPGMRRALDKFKYYQKNNPVYVWSDENGKHKCYDSLQKCVKRYLNKAGFPDHRPHDLRHSFITNLIDVSKLEIQEVQKLARHKNIKMTMDYYANKELSRGKISRIDFMEDKDVLEYRRNILRYIREIGTVVRMAFKYGAESLYGHEKWLFREANIDIVEDLSDDEIKVVVEIARKKLVKKFNLK